MKKWVFCLGFLTAVVTCLAEGTVKGSWVPFKPVENSTLKVISDPGAYAALNSDFTWELAWTCQEVLPKGTEIQLNGLNLRTYNLWTYTHFEIDQAEIVEQRPLEVTATYLFSVQGKGWKLFRARLKNDLKPGDTLKISITAVPPFLAGLYDAVSVYVKKDGQAFVKADRATAVLKYGPNKAARFAIYSHPTPDINGKVRTVLSVEDRFGYPTEYEKPVSVALEWDGKVWPVELKKSQIIFLDAPKDIGRLKAVIQTDSLSMRETINNGKRLRDSYAVTGNPVWAQSPNGKMAGFGEFHWHTEASGDGGGSLVAALTLARDHLNMNYCMPSDHTPNKEKWDYNVAVMDQFNEDDKFATMYGWENSTKRGHDNYYFTKSDHPMVPYGPDRLWRGEPDKVQDQLSQLQDSLQDGEKFIAIPHHTNSISSAMKGDGTPYWFPYPFTKGDNFHRLIEIFQTRGNMERDRYDDADLWRAWCGTNGSSVQDALEKGYKVGFTGGTDDHASLAAHPFMDRKHSGGHMPIDSIIMTGVWTDRIERQSVWQALYDRHTWAVWDTRALVYFAVNDAPAGDEIKVAKDAPIKAFIKISAEDALQSIEIVSEKKTVWSGSTNDLDFEKTIELATATKDTHFYLRALQRDGGIIYASPVFVTVEDNQSKDL